MTTISLRARQGAAAACLSLLFLALPGAQPAAAAAPLYPLADPDRFYAAPADLGRHHNGEVLRSRAVPAGPFSGARVWQLLFRSENSAGKPIAAATTLLEPSGGAGSSSGIRPLLSYQPFVNALGLQCAPSHSLFNGSMPEASALNVLLQRGWAVAVPDHLGPTSAYGAAKLGGQIVLDGLRAVRGFAPAGLHASPVGLLGYSGGAMASGFAAALAPTYAPELPIVGVAQGGLPVDLGQIAIDMGLKPSPLFGLGFAAAMGLEREYPARMHFTDNLNPAGKQLRGRIANACTDEIIKAGSNLDLQKIGRPGVFDADDSTKRVIHENSLAMFRGVPRAPVYEWHGALDQVSVPLAQRMAGRYCRAGGRVLFDVIPDADHGLAIPLGLPRAYAYLADRFAGRPAPSNC